jgi:membrane-associated protease RseP (regulator of RpoE activity)
VGPRSSLNGLSGEISFPRTAVLSPRLALHVALFATTLLTTTVVGVVLAHGFQAGQAVTLDQYGEVLMALPSHPGVLWDGLAFSLTLLIILMAHEMGHYLACRYYGIDASLPYFLPFPSPIGTLGAFIRIRSPIYTRRALLDVGVGGPLAGFAFLVPALWVGLLNSKVVPGVADQGDLVFGVSAIQRLLEMAVFPGVPSVDILLHPVARAAWVGIFATALNLVPIGQADGGHIMYAFTSKYHRLLSRIFAVMLFPLGFFIPPHSWTVWPSTWAVWPMVLAIFALKHPVICDTTPLGRTRGALGVAALVVFLLTFMFVPVR